MELRQTQSQILNPQQIQGLSLLQMGSLELEQYLRELAQENPMVDLEPEFSACEKDNELLGYLRWLEDNDRQNLYYAQMSEEELDPLSRVGTEGGLEETLFRFLSRQLYTMDLEEELADAVRYLASGLDGRGYLAAPMPELARSSRIPLSRLKQALEILQGLEPAGVGAENLSQCLELQLLRIREDEPLSDQKLADLLAQAGCPVSRRTVAKYRGEMNIPDRAGRARFPSGPAAPAKQKAARKADQNS